VRLFEVELVGFHQAEISDDKKFAFHDLQRSNAIPRRPQRQPSDTVLELRRLCLVPLTVFCLI
jgi:hypothetical protein